MMMLIGPRHSSGAHDFRAPLEWRGPMTVVFHEARDRWIRGLLARNPCAIGIEPVHTRADSCGLRGLPPRAIRRKSHFAPGGLIVFRTAYVDGPRSARAFLERVPGRVRSYVRSVDAARHDRCQDGIRYPGSKRA